jgi:hypothetical protein
LLAEDEREPAWADPYSLNDLSFLGVAWLIF